ncbi:hypothetical protein EVAR_98407_1 [Eumeta japonica]|uniref:Uncharacterized protein n=1 Tax=Eumeta variegata TaxID=151549 RepID=A0A4C1XT36_EUMVA|nr:hypothetical protein EVAR_98407_1 [Eumeta japonica]
MSGVGVLEPKKTKHSAEVIGKEFLEVFDFGLGHFSTEPLKAHFPRDDWTRATAVDSLERTSKNNSNRALDYTIKATSLSNNSSFKLQLKQNLMQIQPALAAGARVVVTHLGCTSLYIPMHVLILDCGADRAREARRETLICMSTDACARSERRCAREQLEGNRTRAKAVKKTPYNELLLAGVNEVNFRGATGRPTATRAQDEGGSLHRLSVSLER